MNQQTKIDAGKIWQVYPDGQPENILFEGTKTGCKNWLKVNGRIRDYKKGSVRLAQVIWEAV